MRLNNANYQAIQDDETKDLRLVVRINFGTKAVPDYVYFTSHADITIPGAVVYPNTVRDLASYSQKLNPIEARSEIGSASFDLVDLNGDVSALLKAKLAAGKGIRKKFAEIFTGFGGLDWADFRLEQTQVVSQKVAYDDGRYKISCQDIQREARKDICTPAKTRLAGNVPAVARNGAGEAITASINVYDTTAFKPNWHGPSYSLTSATLPAGTLASPRGVYVFKIKYQDGWEICVATGKTATSFTNVYRGMFGTAIVAHEIDGDADPQNGPEIEEIIYLELPVLKAIYALLTGKLLGQPHTLDAASGTYKDELPPEWHLGIPEEFVDKDAFLSAGLALKEDLTDLYKSADDTGFIVRFDNIAKGDGKKFIEKELSLLAGVMLRVAANGQYTLKRMTGVLTDTAYVDVLDQTNIVSYSDLTQDLDAVHNQFVIDWSYLEFPEAKQYFRSDTLNDLESQSVHGESKPLPLAFKGLHGARHTENTLKTTFNALRDRHSGPPLRLTLELLPSKNNLEVGDIVRVRLPQIRDYTGNTTTLDRSFEVQSVQIDQSSQKIKVELFGSSRKAAPITYSAAYVLPNGWYSTGAQLWPQPVSGGITTASANVPAGVYYYPGDLTINHPFTFNGTVQLRVMGTLTLNALGDGRGRSGATGAAFFGTTEPTGSVLWYLKSGKRKVTSTRGTVYKGQTDTLPQLNIENRGGELYGLPTALNGSKGAQGGEGVSHVTGNPYYTTPGGAGGNGGAGLCLVVRNMVFGAGGRIDTSGTDGANGAPQSTVVYSGSGAGGAPGAVLVLFDGTPPVPVWNGKIDAWYGDCPIAPNLGSRPSAPVIKYSSGGGPSWHSYYEGRPKENAWISAFRWGYVPRSLTAYPDYRLSLSGGNVTFSQPAAPTNADCQRLVRRDLITNDLWLETDAGNKLRRWDGSAWVDASDADIAVAIGTANSAAAEAANAQATATAANAQLSDIAADGKLTPVEKRDAIRLRTDMLNEQAGIEAQATTFGITTEKTDYTNAMNALASYLGGLTPNWDDTSTTTTISRTIWKSNWATFYTKRQALLNKIAAEAAKRANWGNIPDRPQSLYALDSRSAAIIETRADGSIFSETFNDPNVLGQWEYYTGSGERTITTDVEVTTGGKVLSIGNNSGDDMDWRMHKTLIPYRAGVLYRIRARVKRTIGAGTFYMGVAGVAADGLTPVNTTGVASWSSQHYIGAASASPGTSFVEYIGYFKGWGSPNAGGASSWNNPTTLHANVRFIRPLYIANYSSQPGTTVIDYIKIEEVPTDSLGRPVELFSGDQNATNGAPAGTLVGGLDAGNIARPRPNLVRNPTALLGGSFWSTDNNLVPVASMDTGNGAGPHWYVLAAQVPGYRNYYTEGITVYAGNPYTLSFWAYKDASSAASIGIFFYNSGGGVVANYPALITNNGWNFYTVTATAPAGTAYARIVVSFDAISGWGYGWNRIKFEQGATASPFTQERSTNLVDFSSDEHVLSRFSTHLRREAGDWTSVRDIVSRINNSGRAVSTRFLRASNAWGNTISKSSYTTLTSVYTAGTARIDIAAFNATYDYGTYAYPSGQITGLLTGTLYYIYAVDPNGDGTGLSYAATRTFTDTTASPDRAYVGKITTATSSGGGSPPDECVVVSMWVGTGKRAGEVTVGDDLITLVDGGESVGLYPCRANRMTLAECVRITTVSGCWVECSIDTPVTLRSGDTVLAPNVRGCMVAVLDRGEYRWEPVASVESIGQHLVAHISVDDGTYAAGGEPDRLVFTHNATQKP